MTDSQLRTKVTSEQLIFKINLNLMKIHQKIVQALYQEYSSSRSAYKLHHRKLLFQTRLGGFLLQRVGHKTKEKREKHCYQVQAGGRPEHGEEWGPWGETPAAFRALFVFSGVITITRVALFSFIHSLDCFPSNEFGYFSL